MLGTEITLKRHEVEKLDQRLLSRAVDLKLRLHFMEEACGRPSRV